ncbi:single-stranded DNA-binding protein [Alistipes sp.]|uniref:single-stranded DNA-binding protein n=1 Tax=Alistipes sp. TaxID=1872444 RepID=UPI000E859B66|nr:single-stranded DNA-binding protein [Alistipes sp.]HBX90856.1 single-stranded DNA-binding protein [Alistipes sp.]HCN13412.1 single-stranded DNA-binding protein [Alistipes sp.]
MVNKVILIGNVGIDPEVRTLEGGAKVARVRLATTERIYDRQAGETKEHTEWHTVTLWRGLADVVDRFVRKGSQIYVEGRLRTREWMDKENNKRYTTEILADTMNLLGRRSDNPASSEGGSFSGTYGQQQAGGYGAGSGASGASSSGSFGSGASGGGYGAAGSAGYGAGEGAGSGMGAAAASRPAASSAPAAPAEDPDDLPF